MSIKQQIENHGPETNQPQNVRELSHGHPICRRFRLRVNTITTMLLHLAYLAPRHISAQTAVHLSIQSVVLDRPEVQATFGHEHRGSLPPDPEVRGEVPSARLPAPLSITAAAGA